MSSVLFTEHPDQKPKPARRPMSDIKDTVRRNEELIVEAEAIVAQLATDRERAQESIEHAREALDRITTQHFRLQRLFNRLEAAITHHERDCQQNDVPDVHDEALWAARDRVLRDAHQGKG